MTLIPRKCYVLYHKDCDDGFTAAWIVRKSNALKIYEHVHYVPIQYGDPIPEMDHGSDILMLDYCASGEVLTFMAQQHNSIWVIDHHKTSIEWVKHLMEWTKGQDGLDVAEESVDGTFVTFHATFGESEKTVRVYHNTAYSGAMLTALEFPIESEDMELVRYVQDRDLWRWELVGSREMSAYIRSFPRTDADWNELAQVANNEELRKAAIEVGRGIMRADTEKCKFVAGKAKPARFRANLGYGVNARMLISELLHIILVSRPECQFAFSYYHDGGRWIYSLRSRGGEVDVSTIAKEFGGGGHPSAAGFAADSLVHLDWES